MFLQIAKPDDVAPWQYTDKSNGTVYESKFHLRIVPDEVQEELRKKHTRKTGVVRGVDQTELDWAGFSNDCLDYAITGWEQVQHKGVDLPCTKEYKVLLPEVIKTEISTMCMGKLLGEATANRPQKPMLTPVPNSAPTSTGSGTTAKA
jgi:hypothetical protein